VNKVESKIQDTFYPLYLQWEEGALSDQAFFKWYDQIANQWMKQYHVAFAPYSTQLSAEKMKK
jgi:hypothetical protein